MTRSDSAPEGNAYAHQLQAESTQPFAVHFNALARAVFDYLRALKAAEVLRQVPPLSTTVLTVMLTEVQPDYLPRLVVACSYRWLAEHTGKSPGHLQRQVAAMEYAGLITVLKHGGRSLDTPNVYELLEQHAPAQQVNARRRANVNHALARGYGGPNRENARRRAKKVLRRRAEFDPSLESISAAAAAAGQAENPKAPARVVHDGEEEAVTRNEELLRAAVVAGKPVNFSEADVRALARHPNCTPDQVRAGVAKAEAYHRKGTLRSAGATIAQAIREQWSPPMTGAARREAAKPEHQQEADALDRQAIAMRDAREAAVKTVVAQLPPVELDRLVDEVLDDPAHQDKRGALAPIAARGRERVLRSTTFCSLIHDKLQPMPAGAVAGPRAAERTPG